MTAISTAPKIMNVDHSHALESVRSAQPSADMTATVMTNGMAIRAWKIGCGMARI
jgi:hypothetical protein